MWILFQLGLYTKNINQIIYMLHSLLHKRGFVSNQVHYSSAHSREFHALFTYTCVTAWEGVWWLISQSDKAKRKDWSCSKGNADLPEELKARRLTFTDSMPLLLHLTFLLSFIRTDCICVYMSVSVFSIFIGICVWILMNYVCNFTILFKIAWQM